MIALNIILLLFSTVTLLVGGTGIMNIMLATVASRIQEIGIRKALGATRGEIRLQFLMESTLISLAGGILGTILGSLCHSRFMCSVVSPYNFRGFRRWLLFWSLGRSALDSERPPNACRSIGSGRLFEIRILTAELHS